MPDTVIVQEVVAEVIVIETGTSSETVQTVETVTEVIAVAEQGPQGIQGPQGPQGPQGEPGSVGSDLSYVHTQVGASASWVVTHNLGKYPSVTVVDSGGTTVVSDVVYDSINQVTLGFTTAFSGQAFLN